MIERIDAFLIWIYEKPLPLLAVTLMATLLGFGLFLLAPQIDQQSVFYLPLLPLHRYGLFAAVIGLTVSLIFYAQHHPPVRSLLLMIFVGGLLLSAMSLIRNDDFSDIKHQQTVRAGSSVYHLGYARDVIESQGTTYIAQSYVVYRCGTLGIFCDVVGRDLVPDVDVRTSLQNLAVMRIADDRLQVIDGSGDRLLFEVEL